VRDIPIAHGGPIIHHVGTPRPELTASYDFPSFEAHNNRHESFKVVHEKPVTKSDGTVVQHIHQHTHIYHGGKPSQSDTAYAGSITRPSRGDSHLASIPPHPNSLFYTAGMFKHFKRNSSMTLINDIN